MIQVHTKYHSIILRVAQLRCLLESKIVTIQIYQGNALAISKPITTPLKEQAQVDTHSEAYNKMDSTQKQQNSKGETIVPDKGKTYERITLTTLNRSIPVNIAS